MVPVPPLLLLLLGAALTYHVIRRLTTLDLLSIPTPWGIPLLGQLIQLAQCANTPHEQFLKWHEQLGNIVRLRIAYRDVVLIADPQVAAQVLSKGPNECFRRAPEYATYDAVRTGASPTPTTSLQPQQRLCICGRKPAAAAAVVQPEESVQQQQLNMHKS